MLKELGVSITAQITGMTEKDFKLQIQESLQCPLIDLDAALIKIPTPDRLLPLEMSEDRVASLKVFKASVSHTATHLLFRDARRDLQEELRQGKGSLGSTVATIFEDMWVDRYVMERFPDLGRDVAYANAIAFLRMNPLGDFRGEEDKAVSALTGLSLIGLVKGNPPTNLMDSLRKIYPLFQRLGEYHELIEAVKEACETLGSPGLVQWPRLSLSAPHRDGEEVSRFFSYIFRRGEAVAVDSSEITKLDIKSVDDALKVVSAKMGWNISRTLPSPMDLEETNTVFSGEKKREAFKERTVRRWETDLKKTRFASVQMPVEDYGEYLVTREKLSRYIKRIILALKPIPVAYREKRAESGFPNMIEAIQVIASRARRSDVFFRREKDFHTASWAILIDNSQSLRGYESSIKEIAVCLAEAACNLLPELSWALYAFDDSFYIIKDFDEAYAKTVKARIGGLTAGGATYMADAVRLASRKLLMRSNPLKVIMLVTDGEPHGYVGIMRETRRAIREANMSGIKLAALFPGLHVPLEIRRDFRYYVIAKDMQHLLNSFIEMYFAISS